jgi:serine/threonine protein kinase/Tol biopolymer transport system component
MTLAAGTRLGPYEILSPIGAGGMGEVYRARDTRLDRTVAVKVLPAAVSSSPEVRQRFEREAKTISQLSHPHICALYDVGSQDGVEYLVMELLEGETLSERLAKAPLPLEAALRYGQDIADALDKAHRRGIVHRDLKPGNVMLTASGVKLLDFGLAKAIQPEPTQGSLTSLPTRQGLTQEGTILGTFQYMAPEQLEGKDADARTDIWAFGCVLYEMATGQKAFSGTSQASLISSIMKENPAPISTLQPLTPPALDRVVRTCLAKDPEDRFHTAHDARLQLQWISEGGSGIGLPAPVAARRKSRERIAWALAAIASAAALGLAAFVLTHHRDPPRMVQTSILPPEKSAFLPDVGPMVMSPDGSRLAFVAGTPEGKILLWVRPLNGISAQPLAGTEGASYPFWSPDSRFLGFFAGGKLKKIDAAGGPPQALCDASPTGRGGTWNREGVIVFAAGPRDPLSSVSAAGGVPVPLSTLDQSKREFSQRLPSFLPDGRHFLYLSQAVPKAGQQSGDTISVGSLDSKERRPLVQVRSNVVFAPVQPGRSNGHLLYARDRTVVAQPFDAKTLRFTGEAVPVGESVGFFANFGYASFTASDNGLFAYQSGAAGGLSQLVWFDRTGKQLETVGAPADYYAARLSHDGRRVAVSIGDPQSGRQDIWIIDLQRGTSTRLTFGPTDNASPVWSADDSRVAFASNRQGGNDLFTKSSSGTGSDDPLLIEESSFKIPTDYSLDGRFLAFQSIATQSRAGWDLWTFSIGDRKPAAFVAMPAAEVTPVFSPDGRWIAYASDESGKQEVYVQPFPASGGKWQISTSGGNQPVWSRDGREIFYAALDGKLMAVNVKTSPGFEAGAPQALFEMRLRSVVGRRYDVAPDGKRFLVNGPIGEVKSSPITLVQNWTAGLEK